MTKKWEIGYQEDDSGELGRKEIRERIMNGDILLLFKNQKTEPYYQVEKHVLYLDDDVLLNQKGKKFKDDEAIIWDDYYSDQSFNDVFYQYLKWQKNQTSNRYYYLMYWADRERVENEEID